MRTLVTILTLASVTSAAAQAANCSLASVVDMDSYAVLTMQGSSEADQDNAAYDWSQCRADALRQTLKGQPQLQARIDTLRKQYREMRSIESELASMRAGGGTLYGHAIPRSFAPLEVRISSLASLARTSAGGARSVRYEAAIRDEKDLHAGYIKALRAYKPTEKYSSYDPKTWTARVNRYEALGKSIMQTLGSRNDVATALGYSILNDWVFWADE